MACVPVLSRWFVAVEEVHTACQESNRRERFACGEPTMLSFHSVLPHEQASDPVGQVPACLSL